MVKKSIVVATLALAALICLGALSCDKLAIKGRVAGTVMSPSGAPHGFTTVVLTNVKTGQEAGRENTSDNGGFILDNVMPAEYSVSVLSIGGTEVPLLEPIQFKLGSGMTKNLKIIVASE